MFALPKETVVITLRHRRRLLPRRRLVTGRARLLLPLQVRAERPPTPVPEMTGDDLKLSGTRADFDPQTGQPIVLMQFTGDGAKKFHDITREEAQRGGGSTTPRAARATRRPTTSTSRSSSTTRSVGAVDRLRPVPGRHHRRPAAPRSPVSAARTRRSTSRSSSRPARCPSISSRSSETEDLRDARQGLAARGAKAAASSACSSSRSSCSLALPLPRPGRGHRPRDLRAPPLRRDPRSST